MQMNIKGRPIHAICIESNIEFFVEPGPKNSQVNCNFIVLAATVSTWRIIVTACTIKNLCDSACFLKFHYSE